MLLIVREEKSRKPLGFSLQCQSCDQSEISLNRRLRRAGIPLVLLLPHLVRLALRDRAILRSVKENYSKHEVSVRPHGANKAHRYVPFSPLRCPETTQERAYCRLANRETLSNPL